MRMPRQSTRTALSLLLLLLGWWASTALTQSSQEPVLVEAVEAVGMTVADMERSIAFYRHVLSFEVVSDVEVTGDAYEHLQGIFGLRMRVVRMRLGDESIVLSEYLTPKGRPAPLDARSNDRWFQHIAIIVSDMARAYQWLRRYNVTHVSTGPQRLPDWNPKAGGIQAFYFTDPDGHPLEILQFPPGKGDPRWHQPTDRLFLGIDHTAIVVSNTAASLTWYRDVLGLKVVGESENYGTEQEHLNQVFGVRLQITTLRAARGPAIEFLEYLTPRDGRPMPVDARANDLIHWQTTVVTRNIRSAMRITQAARAPWVSSGAVTLPEDRLGFTAGLLVRDPDGHVLQLVEK